MSANSENAVPEILYLKIAEASVSIKKNLAAMEMEASSRNIFWGLVVKPGKRYETEVCTH